MSYDGAGNVRNDGRNSYLYDIEGRLCAVAEGASAGGFMQYIYDAEGRRVAKLSLGSMPANCNALPASNFAVSNQYLLGLGGQQVTELDGSGNWKHTNAFLGGGPTATYDANGLHFYIADPLGTKRVQATISATGKGVPDLNCLSLPFGNNLGNSNQTGCVAPPVGASGQDATEHHFTGKERDAESGNDYFGARYYSSAMGRFMSPDWSAKEEPVPYAKLDNPQTLNLYAYMTNNPLGGVDSDGHGPILDWFVKHVVAPIVVAWAKHEVKVANEHRQFVMNRQTNDADRRFVQNASNDQINRAYRYYTDSDYRASVDAAAQAAVTVTQWGWPGQQGYIDAKNQLNKINTPEGTIDNQALGNGKIPTQQEAIQMIEESGGRVERIEEGHGPDSVSHHDYPHINYTTESGVKGTIQIQP